MGSRAPGRPGDVAEEEPNHSAEGEAGDREDGGGEPHQYGPEHDLSHELHGFVYSTSGIFGQTPAMTTAARTPKMRSMASKPPTELDLVEFTVPIEIWSAGTVATVLEVFPAGRLLVEVADEHGRTLGLPIVPPEAVRHPPGGDTAQLTA